MTKCHSDMLHEAFKCPKPCERLFDPCNHSCIKTCGEPCGHCKVPILNVALPCGHIKEQLPCYVTRDLKTVDCKVPIATVMPGCRHTIPVPCNMRNSLERVHCIEPCNALLACGHQCRGSCGSCRHTSDGNSIAVFTHKTCSIPCGRLHDTCSHICRKACHSETQKDCGLCKSRCEVRCAHSRCDQLCHEPCTPCVEMCTWTCEHQGSCKLPCSAPCNRLPCSKRCTKVLKCSHQCPSLCGEICPSDYCQLCSGKGDEQVDLLLFEKYSDIDLDSTPIVVLACGHFFTAESLDGVVSLGESYEIDKEGNFTGFRDISSIQNQDIPRCPNCKRAIRQFATQRYNRVINRATIDETTKRFLRSGETQLQDLEEKVSNLDKALTMSRKEMITQAKISGGNLHAGVLIQRNIIVTEAMDRRRRDSRAVIADIEEFLKSVSHKNHPLRKMHDATIKAIQSSQDLNDHIQHLTINHSSAASANNRVVFGARALQIFVKYTTLIDMLESASDLKEVLGEDINTAVSSVNLIRDANDFFELCWAFIDDCKAENFSKFDVEARIHYAQIVRLYQSYIVSNDPNSAISESSKRIQGARELLQGAKVLCDTGFQNAGPLRKIVRNLQKLLSKEWYEPVSAEELAGIKAAMVNGRGGIATHSGHWYNCRNGHPVSCPISDFH
jgi:hypothetical protein